MSSFLKQLHSIHEESHINLTILNVLIAAKLHSAMVSHINEVDDFDENTGP